MVKLSFRETLVDDVAYSLYNSALAANAMSQISEKFPNYNSRNDDDHKRAVEFVVNTLFPLINSAANAHGVSSEDLTSKLNNMVSEGIS